MDNLEKPKPQPPKAYRSQSMQGHKVELNDPEPWPTPVDGAILLQELVDGIRRFVVMKENFYLATATWILLTYCFDAFSVTPILAVLSPEKQCGKTTLLDVLCCLVCRPLLASNISASAVFRVVEQNKPTLLIDEADTFLRDDEGLRGILNSGHRAGGTVIRIVGESQEVRKFSTYGPKVIALIGKLPDTLQDRSVCILLQRRSKDETVQRFRSSQEEAFKPLTQKAMRWAKDHMDSLAKADPVLPDFLYNRTADNWSPLLAIADEIDDAWPEKIRKAAEEIINKNIDDTASIRTLLLADIKELFEEQKVDRFTTKDLIAALVDIEDRPWSEWKNGKPLSSNQLSRLLQSFSIHSNTLRTIQGPTAKGYKCEQFSEAWKHYLPECDVKNENVTACYFSENALNTNENATCDVVTFQERGCSDLFEPDDDIPF